MQLELVVALVVPKLVSPEGVNRSDSQQSRARENALRTVTFGYLVAS